MIPDTLPKYKIIFARDEFGISKLMHQVEKIEGEAEDYDGNIYILNTRFI
jgi:hypothetical protein